MDPNFWLERWREGRTHFHQDRVQPLLQKFWPLLAVPPGRRVLVPLCGKSLDMIWLAAQGYHVLGIDLSPLAAEQFFDENALRYTQRTSPLGTHYVADAIEIICGDIFTLGAATLSTCDAVYDRAALIALPEPMRVRYVSHLYASLPAHYQGLLITLDYPQEQMPGPPFCVSDSEIQALFEPHSTAEIIDRRDILKKEAKFFENGVTRLDTLVYRLGRRAAERG